MGLTNSFQTTSLMIVCFGSAAILFWSTKPLTISKPMTLPTPQAKITPVRFAKLHQAKQVMPIAPVLKNAISLITAKVVVDLSEAKVHLYWGDRIVNTYSVAVGQPGWETPVGKFKVEKKLKNPIWQQPITGELIKSGPSNPLGKRWIGFWSDKRHHIGFHGTNDEKLVGQPVSHGCLRMRNQDIQALYEQVVMGTPVVVRH